MVPSAPAVTARSMNRSGSSTNTSTRAVLLPSEVGVSQPLFWVSPRKNGAPSTAIPTTPPRFHNSFAPIALAYHCAAADASETASITEMTGSRASFAMANVLPGLNRSLEEEDRGPHWLICSAPFVPVWVENREPSDCGVSPHTVQAVFSECPARGPGGGRWVALEPGGPASLRRTAIGGRTLR